MTIEVPLTRSYVALVDEADWPLISQIKWHVLISPRCNTPYAVAHKRSLSMHLLLMGAVKGQRVDHRDGNGLNNRRQNLRFATNSQNIANMRTRGGSSQYKGVYYDKRAGRWKAQIGFNGKRIPIGRYAFEEDAARAYDAKAAELFGEFARLNFPSEAVA